MVRVCFTSYTRQSRERERERERVKAWAKRLRTFESVFALFTIILEADPIYMYVNVYSSQVFLVLANKACP